MEGSDLWYVIRISISIDFSYIIDLKEEKRSRVMKCVDDIKWKNLVNIR